MNLNAPGAPTRSSLRSVDLGLIPPDYAHGQLYCLSEQNDVVPVEADPVEFVEQGRFRIASTVRPSGAHPGVANGRLSIRDQERRTAYDVRAE